MSIVLDGTTGITTPGLTNTGTETIVNLTTTGNTILGDASTDTLNVGNGGLVKDASGNVGIGTSSPTVKLTVSVPNGTQAINAAGIGIGNGTAFATGNSEIYTSSTDMGIGTGGSNNLKFWTASAERMRIASGGQVCVNTPSTNGILNVAGNIYWFNQTSGAGNSTLKWSSSTGLMTYDTSSRLVKDNIIDSPYGLAEILRLKSRKYFRTDDQRDEIGLVADEVQAVLPEFVPFSPKSLFTKNEDDTELVPSGVYYEKLSSVLIKAIQELKALVDTQASTITQLQADVAALKGTA
jgi:hypothetical protein